MTKSNLIRIALTLSVLAIAGSVTAVESVDAIHEVKANGITIKLNRRSGVSELLVGSDKTSWTVSGGTSLAGMQPQQGDKGTFSERNGSWAFTRNLTNKIGQSAKVTDTFTAEKNNVRWDVEIFSPDTVPWSTDIICGLDWAAPKDKRLWSAWGSPDGSGAAVMRRTQAQEAVNGTRFLSGHWTDPLVSTPFANRRWHYGNVAHAAPIVPDFVSLPLFSVLNPTNDTGITWALSPENPMIRVKCSVSATGQMKWTHSCYRLGRGDTLKLTMHLVPHEGSWRGGLRFLTERYPGFFDPPNPKAHEIGGCGAYSTYERPIDIAKFKKMAFGFNWKMCDDSPYFGMFIPPVKDAAETWTRMNQEYSVPGKPKCSQTSCRQMNDYARYLKTNGFCHLSYFDVTEFGDRMKGRKPVLKKDDPELWKDPMAFLTYRLPNAVLPPLRYSAYGTVVVDPGDPDLLAFWIEQLERHIKLIPDSDGICIDRMDWLSHFNTKGNDGVSMVKGKYIRSLFRSWEHLMSQMGPLMHKAGKVIFVNPHTMRLETCKEVDGIYNEFGQIGLSLNTAAFIGLRKPVIQWTWQPTYKTPDPDSFMQRHLYMGCFPTAPYPYNHHCIRPTPAIDQLYLDYGPLLNALRGKKWALTSDCVKSDSAKVNLFEVPGGYALPVTFAGKAATAVVQVRNIPSLAKLRCIALHPGNESPIPVNANFKDGVLELAVPLSRGCAMVELTMFTSPS